MGILDRFLAAKPAPSPLAAFGDMHPAARFDAAGRLTEANGAFHALLGYAPGELAGAGFASIAGLAPAARPDAAAAPDLWSQVRSGALPSARFSLSRKGGDPCLAEAVILPDPAAGTDRGAVLLVAREATEDWRAEALSRGRLDAIHRANLVAEFDTGGILLWANERFLRSFDTDLDSVKGRHHDSFVPGDEAEGRDHRTFWAGLAAGQIRSGTYRRLTASGRAIWLAATYAPVSDGSGVPRRVLQIASDASDARQEALDNEARRSAMARSHAVIEFDRDGNILDASAQFLDLFGYTIEEIRGQHHRILCSSEETTSPAYAAFWKRLRDGQFDKRDYRRLGKGAREIWISASYNPILGSDGRVAKVVKFATDITGRKRATDILMRALERLAAGDLTARIDEALTPEFDRIRLDYNSALGALNSLVADITERSGSAVSRINEIAQAATSLSQRTEQQAATLQETAAAMHQMTASARLSSTSADEARQLVDESRNRTEAGAAVVREAVTAMQDLAERSEQISRITGVIDEIAFQTNLLALNAGVEAARAGDAGRGFAVVASEVRALAQRSSDAAREIAGLISASVQRVDRCVSLVSQGGNALGEIEASVREIASRIGDIASSAREQSAGFGEINTAIGQLDSFTQQNAAMFEQTTAATRMLTEEMGGLTEATGGFRIAAVGAPVQGGAPGDGAAKGAGGWATRATGPAARAG
ncbi:MAG: methyl-accepting chemotaxis protein [Pseudomonadota bacterium]